MAADVIEQLRTLGTHLERSSAPISLAEIVGGSPATATVDDPIEHDPTAEPFTLVLVEPDVMGKRRPDRHRRLFRALVLATAAAAIAAVVWIASARSPRRPITVGGPPLAATTIAPGPVSTVFGPGAGPPAGTTVPSIDTAELDQWGQRISGAFPGYTILSRSALPPTGAGVSSLDFTLALTSPTPDALMIEVRITHGLDVASERQKAAGMTATPIATGVLFTSDDGVPPVFYSGDDGTGISAQFASAEHHGVTTEQLAHAVLALAG